MPAPLFGRVVLVGLLCLILTAIFNIVVAGRRMAVHGRSSTLLEQHTRWSSGLVCTTLCTLFWLEIVLQARAFDAHPVSSWLLWVHLPFASTFLMVFLAMKSNPKFNGLGNPQLHRVLVRVVYVCLGVVFPTGIAMIWQMW